MRSATELFAARGPSAVSLREIAAHAGVNFGLIHQYIGTKDNLLRLAFQRASGKACVFLGVRPNYTSHVVQHAPDGTVTALAHVT